MSGIKKQIFKLYLSTTFESLSLGGASWVALLAMRGYTIAEIGVIEAIFHCVSLCGEIPSGVIADVLGRKKTMVLSRVMSVFSAVAMLFSNSFEGIILAIGISALSYNLASGTREALAYDSLKKYGREEEYNKFAANEMMIYRVGSALSTLLAGLALYLGYKKAYAIAINSLIGTVATLLLFFLQAKLPAIGLNSNLLGPALFLMTMGAAIGAKLVQYFSKISFGKIIAISSLGIACAMISLLFHNPYLVIIGGFIAAFSDDFMEVRADIVLNEMIPSEQRATLVSVCSFAFSIVMIILSPIMGMLLDLI